MEQCIAACDPSSGSGHTFAMDSSGTGASASACAMFTLLFVGPEDNRTLGMPPDDTTRGYHFRELGWCCQFYATTRIRNLDPDLDSQPAHLRVADSVGLTAEAAPIPPHWDPHWLWGAAGQDCDAVCAPTGLACNAAPPAAITDLAQFQALADAANSP